MNTKLMQNGKSKRDEVRMELHAQLEDLNRQIHEKHEQRFDAICNAFSELKHEPDQIMPVAQFDKAKTIYMETQHLFDQIGFVFWHVYKKQVSVAIYKRNFDIMLQTILLRTAVGDSDFSRIERQFIQGLTEYGDVVSWVNQLYNHKREDMTWGKLYYLEEDELIDLMNYITSNEKTILENAFLPIVAADDLTAVSYKEKILENVKEICRLFMYVDGDGNNPKEITAMERAIDIYFEFPILKAEYQYRKIKLEAKN